MAAPSRSFQPFDASIALREADLPTGMDHATADHIARSAIATLPSAGAVSIAFYAGDSASMSPAIQVWERGHSLPHDDADAIAASIRTVLESALGYTHHA